LSVEAAQKTRFSEEENPLIFVCAPTVVSDK